MAKKKVAGTARRAPTAKYPKTPLEKVLRIPRAILEQNAGKPCSDREAVGFLGLKLSGPSMSEISSAIKYGLLTRPSPGKLQLTERAKKIIRPQSQSAALEGLREAILEARLMGDVYKHYRGENLPDAQFLTMP